MNKSTKAGWWIARLCACAMCVTWAQTSQAISINLTYDSSGTNPTWDSGGASLGVVMNAAADIWEDIIEDSWTIDIEYRWANLDDGDNILGLHTGLGTAPWAGERREDEARIQLDSRFGGSDRLWFNDTTPFDHSEYDLTQHLVAELADPSDWYYSDPPDLLEMDYWGPAATGAPPEAATRVDLLTVCLHEIGHAMGLTRRVAEDDVGHYAYDFPSNMVDHDISGVDTFNTEDLYHIDPEQALMHPSRGSNQRVLPSATDVMAMARASDWTNIDLPRQDLWDAYDMNQRDSWEGNNVPDADDDAYVRFGTFNNPGDPDTAWMTDNLHFETLTITNGSSVDTNNHTLTVDDPVIIEQAATGSKPALIVDSGGMLISGVLEINGGELRMTGGSTDIGILRTAEHNGQTASITGWGTVNANYLVNNGEIRAFPNVLLRIEWSGVGVGLDLDGESPGGGAPEPGVVSAQYGDIEIAVGGMMDDFSGEITIGSTSTSQTRYLNIIEDWALGAGGVISMIGNSDGSFTKRAEIRGGEVIIKGWLYASHYSRIDADMEFRSTSQVNIGEDGLLELGTVNTDSIMFQGTDIQGLGTLRQNGDTVAGGTTISVAYYDMDGTTVSDMRCYGPVYVTSGQLTDSYTGHLTVTNWGSLNMDLTATASWTADISSTLTVSDNGTIGGGTKLILEGTLETANGGGMGWINCPIDVTANATVDVSAAGDTLELAGSTKWSNPVSVTGGGTLVQTGTAEVLENTTIGTYYYDWDGSAENSLTQINPGKTFTIDVEGLEAGTSGGRYDGTVHILSGTLDMSTNGPWDLGGVMYLNKTGTQTPTLNGQTVRIDGGQINVLGGPADINAPVTLAGSGISVADGATLDHNATLNVEGGTLSIAAGGKMNANGSTYFYPGGTVDVDGELELNGPLSYYGGTFTGSGLIQQDTPASIQALVLVPTTIGVSRFDMDGTFGNTKTELNASLTLNVDGLDLSDNAFGGTVTIYNDYGEATLTVNLPGNDTWALWGTMDIFAPDIYTATSLAGSDMLITGSGATSKGTVNVRGMTQFDARIDVHNYGQIVMADGDALLTLAGGTLADPNRLISGEINGPGTLAAHSDAALHGYGDIEADIEFAGNSELMADDGTLNLLGTLIDLGGTIGTADDDGTLNVTKAWNTNLADRCELNDGEVQGGAITNDGMITGHGRITSKDLTNNGILAAHGGTLEINTTLAPDLDGTGTEDGTLDATFGSIHVTYLGFSAAYAFNSNLKIGQGQSFKMDSGWLAVIGGSNFGKIAMTGGAYIASDLYLYGKLETTNNPSTIDSDATFYKDSTTSLDADLHLTHTTTVEKGVSITGAASLVNDDSAFLDIHDYVVIETNVVNDGAMLIGIGTAATARFNGYRQGATGRIGVDLFGLSAGSQYDQLVVDGPVDLAGQIEISLLFSGSPTDTFDIITHTSRTGTFDTITIPAGPMSIHYSQSRTRVIRHEWAATAEDLAGIFDVSAKMLATGAWNWTGQAVKQGAGILELDLNHGFGTGGGAALQIAEGAVRLGTTEVPGNGIDKLEVDTASIAEGASLICDVQGSSSDFVNVVGQMSVDDSEAIQINWLEGLGVTSMFGGAYTIAHYTGTPIDDSSFTDTTNALGNIGAAYIDTITYDAAVGADKGIVVTLYAQGPGDTDLNGVVNSLDLSDFGEGWGSSDPAWANGDFDFNGVVNSLDLSTFGEAWGWSAGSAVGTDMSFVPEPGTIIMLLLGSAGLLLYRKRR